jgi:hypothetical protein
MNDDFYSHALGVIVDLTPAEIQAGLAAVEITVTNHHSGELLSEVPFEETWVGMEVLDAAQKSGSILHRIPLKNLHRHSINTDDNWITVEWKNGKKVCLPQKEFNNVRVK